MVNEEGGGVKNVQKTVDMVYGWPLKSISNSALKLPFVQFSSSDLSSQSA